MRLRYAVLLLIPCCLAAAPVAAQLSLTPKAQSEAPAKRVKTVPAPRPAAKASPKANTKLNDAAKSLDDKAAAKKSATSPPPAASDASLDLAFGAYQRGDYVVAREIATKRATEQSDPYAMTLLGEMYANGQGVRQDDAKAEGWYKLAAERGNRESIFAIALFRLAGRNGPANRNEAAKLLATATKLGHPLAAYNLALLYLEGEVFPQDFARAAELLRQAADAGNADAQYALAVFYKEGRAVPQDLAESARWLRAAADGDHIDAMVEYAIALYNGTGVPRDEEAAVSLLLKAARKGSAIAQNRLARVLATGRGAPKDEVEALKWHLIAKEAGNGDPTLDSMLASLDPAARKKAEEAALRWFSGKAKGS